MFRLFHPICSPPCTVIAETLTRLPTRIVLFRLMKLPPLTRQKTTRTTNAAIQQLFIIQGIARPKKQISVGRDWNDERLKVEL